MNDTLRDIRGLDPAPWWPIAPGWWLVLLALLLAVWGAWWLWRHRPIWQNEARIRLARLRRRLRNGETQPVLAELSELLRRIALARHGRSACAGLVGENWLKWLAAQDPKGFAWDVHGRVLLRDSYAPAATRVDPALIYPLLDAVPPWVEIPLADPWWRVLAMRIASHWRAWRARS